MVIWYTILLVYNKFSNKLNIYTTCWVCQQSIKIDNDTTAQSALAIDKNGNITHNFGNVRRRGI